MKNDKVKTEFVDSAHSTASNAQNPANPAHQTESSQDKSFFGIIIHSFFVIPFLIAVFGVLLFTAVRLLTMEEHTIYDYLNDIKTGGSTKRWQSAFELTKLVANPKAVPQDERFTSEMISAYQHSKHDDERVRQYLALAMGRSGHEKFVGPLLKSLPDEKPETLYAIIYALGMLKSKQSSSVIQSFLDHPEARIRLASIIALGNIADPQSIASIKQALYDSEPNVQWDAAIALAKMKNASGKDILLKLLDRNFLSKFPQVDAQEQTHMLLVTIEAAAHLDDPDLTRAINQLAHGDQNMNVRNSAMKFIK